MTTRYVNARVVDALGERRGGVTVSDGFFAEAAAADETIDCGGLTLMPALVDTHCHLRDPGFPDKETMETGMRAALAGGYATLCAMANTRPVIETPEQVTANLRRAEALGLCRLVQSAAAGRELGDAEPTDRAALSRVTCVISNDGKTVLSDAFMRQLLIDSREHGFIVSTHCQPERAIIKRDLALLREVGGRLHIGHVSRAESLDMIRRAKSDGLSVTCEAMPHHLFAWDMDYRVNPPIRSREDAVALAEAVADKTVDCLATDHAPHTAADKAAGAAGISNIEHALAIFITVLSEYGVPLSRISEAASLAPSRLLGLGCKKIAVGEPADFILLDPEREWTIDRAAMLSRSNNTPFGGRRVKGRVLLTAVKGNILYDIRHAQ